MYNESKETELNSQELKHYEDNLTVESSTVGITPWRITMRWKHLIQTTLDICGQTRTKPKVGRHAFLVPVGVSYQTFRVCFQYPIK